MGKRLEPSFIFAPFFFTTVLGPIDPARDIETLNEDQESEYVGDSECGTEYDDGSGSPRDRRAHV
jgi:hypothetical protein